MSILTVVILWADLEFVLQQRMSPLISLQSRHMTQSAPWTSIMMSMEYRVDYWKSCSYLCSCCISYLVKCHWLVSSRNADSKTDMREYFKEQEFNHILQADLEHQNSFMKSPQEKHREGLRLVHVRQRHQHVRPLLSFTIPIIYPHSSSVFEKEKPAKKS